MNALTDTFAHRVWILYGGQAYAREIRATGSFETDVLRGTEVAETVGEHVEARNAFDVTQLSEALERRTYAGYFGAPSKIHCTKAEIAHMDR